MRKPLPLWVVEMLNEEKNRFEPTVGVALDRISGRQILRDWQTRNPDDAFRLKRYEPQPNRQEGK